MSNSKQLILKQKETNNNRVTNELYPLVDDIKKMYKK